MENQIDGVTSQRKIDYCQTFGTEAGMRVLEDLKKRFHWYFSTYSPIAGETQLNEGGRSVLLHIETTMKTPEEELIQEEE